MSGLDLCRTIQGKPKVPDFPLLLSPEDVCWFDIAMNYSLAEHVLDCFCDLGSDRYCLRLW